MTGRTPQEIVDKEKKPSEAEVKFAKACKQGIKIENINWLLFFTFFSFLFYLGNICWDIYSLIHYWNRKDDWYFRCTLAFVLGPMIIKTIYNYYKVKSLNWVIDRFLRIVGLCQIPRYVDLIKHGFKARQAKLKTDEPQNEPLKDEKDHQDQTGVNGEAGLPRKDGLNGLPGASGKNGKDDAASRSPGAKRDNGKSGENGPQQGPISETGSTGPPGFRQDQHDMYFVDMIWEDAELVKQSQFNTFMTSAPQLLLNLYILIKGESELGVVSIIRIIISIGILAFAIVSYEKKICLINGITPNEEDKILNDDAIKCFNQTYRKTIAIQFFAHLHWLVARFIALSLFTSVFGWFIWPACLSHIILIFIWHWRKNYEFMTSLRLSFLHLFAYLYTAENETDQMKHPRFSPVKYQTICICENLFLMALWSRSFIFNEKTNLGSIMHYCWNDSTIFVFWIVQILTVLSSFALFWLLDKERQSTDTSNTHTA